MLKQEDWSNPLTQESGTQHDALWLHQKQTELDAQYQVLGRFYDFGGVGRTYRCRDQLEIHRGLLQVSACDAIFVMMNPGSSKPRVERRATSKDEASLVPTKPDTTQYQLMRLMRVLGWRRIRVLNLSDLCNTKSAKFYEDARDFVTAEGHDQHSLFSLTRRDDLTSALIRRPGAPIVAAWGVSRELRAMASSALRALDGKVQGLSHQNGSWAFRHPLPQNSSMQAQWRREALELLRSSR